jgi:GntR family transcriptional repressor for pyruvate dehydrogenase complex
MERGRLADRQNNERVPFTPLTPSRLSERVADELLRAVVSGGLPVGTALPSEGELARRFGVSRLTIREAVQTLYARGVLQARQGAPIVVTDGTARALSSAIALAVSWRSGRFADVLEVRGMLDREIARLAAARRTPADLQAVHNAFERMRGDAADAEAYAEAHADFHTALAAATHNQGLLTMSVAIRDLLVEAMRLTFPRDGATVVDLDSHWGIAGAIEAGDAEAALAATQAHLSKADAAYGDLTHQQVSAIFDARGGAG